MIVTVDSKRRITLPSALMAAKPGDTFDAQFDSDEGALIFRRVPEKPDWLDVLGGVPCVHGRHPAPAQEAPVSARRL